MKKVILSADGDSFLYSVPDEVANDLRNYCINFCDKWLLESPHAQKYRKGKGLCYDESDFIEYLNKWIFPNQPSKLIENLGWIPHENIVNERYQDIPWFNF